MKARWKWGLFYCVIVCATILGTQLGSKVVSAMAEHKSATNQYCIVIDPGHGGEDGGAVSISNLPESGYNLSIALRLQDLLHLLGYQTKMIRSEDVSVYTKGETISQKKTSDLQERVRIVNETDGAVLLSIHQNHFPDPVYHGAQVFYAATAGSEVLAEQMQNLFRTTINPGSRRQIKKAEKVYLMSRVHCPAVLIECGFLSNPQEEYALRNPEYQRNLSSVIAVAVVQFLSNT